jgi:hypothetical protein
MLPARSRVKWWSRYPKATDGGSASMRTNMLRENILWATVIEHDGRISKQDTFLMAAIKIVAGAAIISAVLYAAYLMCAAL